MAKFHGAIGYVKSEETKPGVWQDVAIERKYYGDVLKNINKWRDGENLNSNLNVDNRLSIVSDSFADKNLHIMRYVQWMGGNWEISSIDVQYPRLILTIGGVYNGPTLRIT